MARTAAVRGGYINLSVDGAAVERFDVELLVDPTMLRATADWLEDKLDLAALLEIVELVADAAE